MKYIYDNENDTYTIGDETLTADEFHERFWVCDHCGEAFEFDDPYTERIEDGDSIYCADCAESLGYQKCERCGEWTQDYLVAEDTAEVYCDSCARDCWYWCTECEEYFAREDSGRWVDGDWYCDSCAEDRGCDDRIRSYHTSKEDDDYAFFDVVNGSEKVTRCPVVGKSPYVGFELEIDRGDWHDRNDALDAFENSEMGRRGFFFYEEDGSLDTGFETISNPATIEYLTAMRDEFDAAFKGVVRSGFRSHNAGSCGLHVHVDRGFFGDKEDSSIAKLLFLMERHWESFAKFSRRTGAQFHWCERDSRSPKEIIKEAKESIWHVSRYRALNLTNSNTIEFRLWRGTLNTETFFATLKFTSRLCQIVKETSATQLAKMTFEDLLGDDIDIRRYWNRRNGLTPDGNDVVETEAA